MLAIGSRFARVEPRRRAGAFLRGLLAGLPRANCWTIAEQAGQAGPRGAQRLLSSAGLVTGGVIGELRAFAVRGLAAPRAGLVIDETRRVKKGGKTAGGRRAGT